MKAAALQRKLFRGKQAAEQIFQAVRRGNFLQATEYVGRVLMMAVGTAFPRAFRETEHPNGTEAQGFDQQFGVETSAPMRVAEMELDADASTVQASYYQPSSPELFRRVMAELNLDWERFTFVDCGSGKGIVLLLASELPFKRVVGIEFAANLHRAAEANIAKFRSATQRCRKVESICADATKCELPAEPTIFYLFNPFGEEILNGFLDNVERSLQAQPREVYFVYVEPMFATTVERRGFATKVKELQTLPCRSYRIYRAGI